MNARSRGGQCASRHVTAPSITDSPNAIGGGGTSVVGGAVSGGAVVGAAVPGARGPGVHLGALREHRRDRDLAAQERPVGAEQQPEVRVELRLVAIRPAQMQAR